LTVRTCYGIVGVVVQEDCSACRHKSQQIKLHTSVFLRSVAQMPMTRAVICSAPILFRWVGLFNLSVLGILFLHWVDDTMNLFAFVSCTRFVCGGAFKMLAEGTEGASLLKLRHLVLYEEYFSLFEYFGNMPQPFSAVY
jgi:hypothetical protein